MRRIRVDLRLRFEGTPPLSKLFGGPRIPTLVDQLGPWNVIFLIEIQACDSTSVVRTVLKIEHKPTY
jgi:hypothetical protein